jgi:thiosulfate dehydrogenase [quinone] large subunit
MMRTDDREVPATVVTDAAATTRGGIAAVRVGVALLWIQNLAWKVPPDFGKSTNGGLYNYARQAIDHQVFPPWAWFVEHVVFPNFSFFGWMTVLLEASIGAFLLIGLATRFWALVGIAQTVVIAMSVLYAPDEWHWSYFLMLLIHVMLFVTAAGRAYGIDGLLRPAWRRSSSRIARLLVMAS